MKPWRICVLWWRRLTWSCSLISCSLQEDNSAFHLPLAALAHSTFPQWWVTTTSASEIIRTDASLLSLTTVSNHTTSLHHTQAHTHTHTHTHTNTHTLSNQPNDSSQSDKTKELSHNKTSNIQTKNNYTHYSTLCHVHVFGRGHAHT